MGESNRNCISYFFKKEDYLKSKKRFQSFKLYNNFLPVNVKIKKCIFYPNNNVVIRYNLTFDVNKEVIVYQNENKKRCYYYYKKHLIFKKTRYSKHFNDNVVIDYNDAFYLKIDANNYLIVYQPRHWVGKMALDLYIEHIDLKNHKIYINYFEDSNPKNIILTSTTPCLKTSIVNPYKKREAQLAKISSAPTEKTPEYHLITH